MNHASKVWSRSKKQINHEILPTTYGVVFIKKKPPNKQEWICHRDRKIRFNCINGTYFVILSSINGFHHFFRPPEWKQKKKMQIYKNTSKNSVCSVANLYDRLHMIRLFQLSVASNCALAAFRFIQYLWGGVVSLIGCFLVDCNIRGFHLLNIEDILLPTSVAF